MAAPRTVLMTGATGYIGGRLVPRIIDEGLRVRVLARNADRVRSRPWHEQVEVAVGDVLDPASLSEALDGVETAYYLVHSMGSGPGFHELDIEAAHTFGQAAGAAGVEHIIYLGGLGAGANLSPHLRSRQECGQALRAGGVAVTEFRAAVVVGVGSISFEMVRYLVERLPVMVCPRWLYSHVQPIAIDDLLDYLIAALDTPSCRGQTVEVGGKDVTTYEGLMLGYARARRLRRLLLPVPVLTPRLSSYWVHWFTPIPTAITRALVEGLRNDVVVTDDLAHRLFPHIEPQDYASALGSVLEEMGHGARGTR